MSAAPVSPYRYLLALNGDLVNVDYIVLIHEDTVTGKVFANMNTGAPIELRIDRATVTNMRRELPFNAVIA